ncbi:MAG: phosphotriesterase-related protein [Frankiales bacterium]|nr:phosphotriesterase-related protein [Frankiales bacterium]
MDDATAPYTITTVLGEVPADRLGTTLMHEHLFVDLTVWFEGQPGLERDFDRPVDMSMLGKLRRDASSVTRDNLRLDDESVTRSEVARYVAAGGTSIVDLSLPGIGRNPEGLRRLAEDADVIIVMGCGFYVEAAHPSQLEAMAVDDIAETLIVELTHGVGDTGIRPGIIGEIGTSGIDAQTGRKVGHVTEQETRVLRACARAALQTGVAVSVHLDARGEGGDEVLDILESESLPPTQIVMGHLDQVLNLDYHRRLADRGVYIEYDSFGREYYWDAAGVYWGNDNWRTSAFATLMREGYTSQLLASQDVCFKMDLRTYGGYGYDHLLVDVLPALLRAGVSPTDLQTVLTANPANVLKHRAAPPSLHGDHRGAITQPKLSGKPPTKA